MHFSNIIAIAFTGTAVAFPSIAVRQTNNVCSGFANMAQCCATDVLNLISLNCIKPPSTPTDTAHFTSICAAIGQQAQCCTLPILGQALACLAPM